MSPIQRRQKLESFWHAEDAEVEQVRSRGIIERDSAKCVHKKKQGKWEATTTDLLGTGNSHLTAHPVRFLGLWAVTY
jgi:hypothetical protein